MEFKNLSDVLSCMQEWESIRNNSSQVVNFLNIGNSFSQLCKNSSSVLHAYPGVSQQNNEFFMFLIPQQEDKQQDDTALFEAITVCPVERMVGDPEQIPENIAKERIDNWNENYQSWANDEVIRKLGTNGIFQAFYMPSSYMQPDKNYITYFALKGDAQSSASFDADLITTNEEGTTAYYDTVKPVPPFSAAPESDFYLLQLATQ